MTTYADMVHWLGKHVTVHLHDQRGTAIGTVSGRVADVAPRQEVRPGFVRDLLNVVDLKTPDGAEYTNSAGEKNESWFDANHCEIDNEHSTTPEWGHLRN